MTSFDEQPDGDRDSEIRLDIARLQEELLSTRLDIERKSNAIRKIEEFNIRHGVDYEQ